MGAVSPRWPYQVLQQTEGGGLVYWNTRLVRRNAGARYRGVTHEYLDLAGGGEKLTGVWFKDHATGANRVDKFERDIRLLTEALHQEPNSARYWFYLAQSYRDAGRTAEAEAAYAKRIEMGGWERCLRALGDGSGFIEAALAAFNARPWRAEPLYDLARFYRERGMNDASLIFSEPGLLMEVPDDILFVEGFVYAVGLKEEYAIAAYYSRDAARKERGHAVCDRLALSPATPKRSRDLARSNLCFYTEPASKLMPSLKIEQVALESLGSRVLNLDHATLPVAADTFDREAQAIELDDGMLALEQIVADCLQSAT